MSAIPSVKIRNNSQITNMQTFKIGRQLGLDNWVIWANPKARQKMQISFFSKPFPNCVIQWSQENTFLLPRLMHATSLSNIVLGETEPVQMWHTMFSLLYVLGRLSVSNLKYIWMQSSLSRYLSFSDINPEKTLLALLSCSAFQNTAALSENRLLVIYTFTQEREPSARMIKTEQEISSRVHQSCARISVPRTAH